MPPPEDKLETPFIGIEGGGGGALSNEGRGGGGGGAGPVLEGAAAGFEVA